MDDSTKSSPCKECENGVEGALGAEVEHLRQHLAERDSHIVALEGEFIKCTSRVNELEDQLSTWREKYERLYDSHKRVQKLNQVLEDKLLQIVDKMKGEKSQLTKDIATLSVRLAESKHNYSMLQKENERYKNDMNLAIQLLQCKPDNFVSQKLDNLPVDTQARVSQYVMSKTSKPSSTSQSKNGNGNSNDIDTFDASEYEFNISASLMSKILEDSIQDTVTKHCDTCTCNKTQNKPFCYNESYYSIATQTFLSGEMKSSPCINCNAEIKSLDSNLSIGSVSTHGIRLINERSPNHVVGPLYFLPQPAIETHKEKLVHVENSIASNVTVKEDIIIEELPKIDVDANKNEIAQKIDDLKHIKRHNGMSMEPSVHHKLCDRTRTPLSSKKSSGLSVDNEDLLNAKEVTVVPVPKEIIPIPKSIEKSADNVSMRKNSLSSMGAVSRTSSVAKSTVSTHKSNTAVGPGPRFCHLRMQAGSKNILLDNAEPDVPPILYRRQSKCNENSLFKELNDDVDNVLDMNKNEPEHQEEVKTDTIVVESTLIDVHVDNNYKESIVDPNNTSINPVLLNVSSSPLQPLKTHNFSHSSENNNNKSQSVGSHHNTSEVDNLLSDFNADIANAQNNNDISNPPTDNANMTLTVTTPTDDNNVKIFNFDRYEQNKLSSQYNKPLRKIDMSHLHSLENTKISKDLPPQGNMPKLEKMVEAPKSTLPPIVNVYPNLTQTHLKVNDNKKVFTNEQSTSSMSSDDSAALLQKQQLLRVAEWVEKNLEQHNNYDNLDDDVNFSTRLTRKENNISRLTETLNELALNMPHPVSKYSKSYRDAQNTWIHGTQNHLKPNKQNSTTKITNVIKETIFPVESGDAVTEVSNDVAKSVGTSSDHKPDKDTLNAKSDKEITPEDLARMEYNVKKFLLSGPYWVNPGSAGRSRRTSSKTETDV